METRPWPPLCAPWKPGPGQCYWREKRREWNEEIGEKKKYGKSKKNFLALLPSLRGQKEERSMEDLKQMWNGVGETITSFSATQWDLPTRVDFSQAL